MVRRVMLGAALAAWISFGCAPADGPIDAPTAISDAEAAMGMENLDSVTYSGTAQNLTNFQQSRSSTSPALNEVASYTRAIDLDGMMSRATGEMMVVGTFGGDPQPQAFNQNANDDSPWAQQLELYLTPWGFLEGAAENGAEARREGDYNIVTWTAPETAPSGAHYTVVGYINNGDNRVERVQTWVENNIAGDMPVVAAWSGYREIDGVMVPSSVVETEAGLTYFTADIAEATIDPANLAELVTPPAPSGGRGGFGGGRGGRGGRGGAPGGRGGGADAAPAEISSQLADGVWQIAGPGAYVSLLVEFADHVVVVEGPQNPARGMQVIAEARRLFPEKPIRYVVNTHPHSDHTGGLPAFVAEGIPIVTHQSNVEFLSNLGNPRTLLADDDPLKQAGTTAPELVPVDEEYTLEDDTRTLELYHVQGNNHTEGMLVAYLPESKILFQADFTLPQPGAEPNEFVVALGQNVQRLGLDFERYYGVHAAATEQTREDFDRALGLTE